MNSRRIKPIYPNDINKIGTVIYQKYRIYQITINDDELRSLR